MQGLKIVEYTPAYAKSIAEMWQKSTDGWNGEGGNETEETILTEHTNSTDLNTYLAVLGDEVVGYCGFSRYEEDEGALYIRLLNARYDCHGKGIGKALVKKSVERTIELNWPRLDIYTWSANTKSIPLYKKCGCFLENRQDVTHLMNFIPTVMQTEAVKDYFKNVNWYDDLKRTIDLEPDGRVENGFDFYEYIWNKNDKKLKMEFERKGRGLRLIETEDYIISLSAPSQNLVFGKNYKATYEIINKSGKPLSIEIIGMDDKNIKFSLNKKVEVTEKETIEGEFYLSEIQEEYGKFKTHPAIVSEVFINGKKALFKLGIVPKFPAKISLCCKDVERYNKENLKMYIDIESYLDEDAIFQFELPESHDIDFSQKVFKIEMKKNAKTSIPVDCILKNPCIYQTELNIKVTLKCGKSIQFKKNSSLIFSGHNSAFGGKLDGKYIVTNGLYRLEFDKNFNEAEIYVKGKRTGSFFLYPNVGKPYSQEFSSMPLQNVKWYSENEKMILSGEYVSKDFKNIVVKAIFKISNNGIFEHLYEVSNTSNEETIDDVYINQSWHYPLAGACIPYDNKIIQVTEPGMEDLEYYDCNKISENWAFTNNRDLTKSLIWPQNLKLSFDTWFMRLEHNIGKIKGGESKFTEPVYLALSTFKNWDEVRRFALKSNDLKYVYSAEDYELNINNSNPFVKKGFDVKIIESRTSSLDGNIIVKSENNFFDEVHVRLQNEAGSISIPISAEKGVENDIIHIQSNLSSTSFERKTSVFYVKNMDFQCQITEEKGFTVYSIGNGVMNIKSAPKFSSGIFSLKFMDKEWLDSSFPNVFPSGWYNPWFGGIQNVPIQLVENGRSLLKEHIETEFIEKEDTLGNRWRGIKTSMCMIHNEDYNGLQINQYFLMLPGVPVLLNMTELTNTMNKFMNSTVIMNTAFFKIGEAIKNSWVSVKNHQGNITKYIAGTKGYEMSGNSSPLYGCDSLDYKIQVNTDFNKSVPSEYLSIKHLLYMNATRISLASDERMLLPNVFYTFTKKHISDKLLKHLQNIKFE